MIILSLFIFNCSCTMKNTLVAIFDNICMYVLVMTDVVCSYISMEKGGAARTCMAHVQTKNINVKRVQVYCCCVT
jgi:hypothetical protein